MTREGSANHLYLAPGEFFGGARLGCSVGGIEVSHRIAAGPPEQVLTHTHEDAHFILVTGGEYVSAAGRRGTGPVLIYNPPGTTHRDHFERGRGSFFAISLSPGYAAAALAGTGVPDAPRYLTAPAQHAIAMRIAVACAVEVATLSVDALCLELLGSMDARGRALPRAPPRWLGSAVELLQDRYREELTIAEIAAAVGVHPIHLTRTFRRHLRCTPGEFARFRRLERAASLLVRTAHPLAEVALDSGFADQSHFSRVFTRYFGLPPGEYRARAG
ncbi:MAG TPA: AraC family transcriptional regulator [Steroidobacteraceae bacterium]